MTVTLAKISINQRMSEETPCYSADLLWLGKKVAEVSNHGHGGPDMVRVTDQAGFDAAVAFIKAMPPVPSGFEDMADLAMDVELWCHLEVGKVEDHKRMLSLFKRTLKKSITVQKGNEIVTYSLKGVKLITAAHIANFKAKNPTAIILNLMPEDEAFAIFDRLVSAAK